MLFRHVCIPLAMLGLCRIAPAQEPHTHITEEVKRDKAFLPVYSRYLDVINTRGIEGLKTLLAPNFTMKWDHESREGEKAVTELKKYIIDPRKGEEVLTAVKLRRLTFVGDRAVVETEETCQFPLRDHAGGKMTTSSDWKQTWRKTPQGWKLILWETGTDKLPPAAVTMSYTLNWTPKDLNAAPPLPSSSGKE